MSFISGLYWFFKGYSEVLVYGHLEKLEKFFIYGELFPVNNRSHWYMEDSQILSFCIMIGSIIGYYLFKKKKEEHIQDTQEELN